MPGLGGKARSTVSNEAVLSLNLELRKADGVPLPNALEQVRPLCPDCQRLPECTKPALHGKVFRETARFRPGHDRSTL